MEGAFFPTGVLDMQGWSPERLRWTLYAVHRPDDMGSSMSYLGGDLCSLYVHAVKCNEWRPSFIFAVC